MQRISDAQRRHSAPLAKESPRPALPPRAATEPIIKTRWEYRALGIACTRVSEPLISHPKGAVPRLRFARGNTVVLERYTPTHRVTTEVTFHAAFFLRFALLLLFLGGAHAFSPSGAPPHAANGVFGGRLARAFHPATTSMAAFTAPASEVFGGAMEIIDDALQRGGEALLDQCMLPTPNPSIQRLVQTDVLRLRATMEAVLCGGEECMLEQPSEVLSRWFEARVPLLTWSAARCLDSVSGGKMGEALTALRLQDAIRPLTREAAPILASCLLTSPWRVCRLAFGYLAYVSASVFRSQARRQELLHSLLDDIASVLEAGTSGARSSRTPRQAALLAPVEVEEDLCTRRALGAVGGWPVGGLKPHELRWSLSECLARLRL
jgi:hypothetical protein